MLQTNFTTMVSSTPAVLQALDTTFSVLKFKSSRLAFVNVYQPTTVHDGTPHYLEVAWRFKLLAAKVRRGWL